MDLARRYQAANAPAAAQDGFGRPAYRWLVLIVLMAAYTLNFVDRSIIGVVQEPLKHDFHLSDLQLGLLGGPTFAILYTLLGIPIARLAERRNRVVILSTCIGLWSAMTAVCGLATGFGLLLLARVGVSIGEAGCTPPAQSVISDYFPARRRATAISIYALGIPLGIMIASLAGGYVAQHFGWRRAFLLLGLPGVALAVVTRIFVREPPRAGVEHTPGLADAFARLWSNRTYRHLVAASTIALFVTYGMIQYLNSFMIRSHGLTLVQSTRLTGLLFCLCQALGTFAGGYLSDRLRGRYPTALLWLPAAGLLAAAPCFLIGFLSPSLLLAIPFFMVGSFGQCLYSAPAFAVAQGVVAPRVRATSVAVLLLVGNLLGYGLGPPLVGMLSDLLASRSLASSGLDLAACQAAKGLALAPCAHATAAGLREAIAVAVLGYLWASFHFLRARRSLTADWVG
jgi:predicted MFS family arabinose efflux permease